MQQDGKQDDLSLGIDVTQALRRKLVGKIHSTPVRMVLAVTGGGATAIGSLLEVPGGSRTLLEAVVPYSPTALSEWLGGRPERFCTPQIARAMAMAAFQRATRLAAQEPRENAEASLAPLAGVSCTASLASDRPKQGAHRAYVAAQTHDRTICLSLVLAKDERSRAGEEELVSMLILNLIAEVCQIQQRMELPLFAHDAVERVETIAPIEWQELLAGRCPVCCMTSEKVIHSAEGTRLVFPGSFNPVHQGHRRMAQIAQARYGVAPQYEMSIFNVDKPPLDFTEMRSRTSQFKPGEVVCLTRTATFEEKADLFPGATFLVGVDTIRRIADAAYYGNDPARAAAAIRHIADRGCRFAVFGRDIGQGFCGLSNCDLPIELVRLCDEIPESQFREDISSTELRRQSE